LTIVISAKPRCATPTCQLAPGAWCVYVFEGKFTAASRYGPLFRGEVRVESDVVSFWRDARAFFVWSGKIKIVAAIECHHDFYFKLLNCNYPVILNNQLSCDRGPNY
jgi:hypothetical protein